MRWWALIFTMFFMTLSAPLDAAVLRFGARTFPMTQVTQLADIPRRSYAVITATGQIFYYNLGRTELICTGEGEFANLDGTECLCDFQNDWHGTPPNCEIFEYVCPQGDQIDPLTGDCTSCPWSVWSSGAAPEEGGICQACSRWDGMFWNTARRECHHCLSVPGAICTDANRVEVRGVFLNFNCNDHSVPDLNANACSLRCPGAHEYWNGTTCAYCDGIVNATHSACNRTGAPISCPDTITAAGCTAMGGLPWGGCSCDWNGCFIINDTTGELSCFTLGTLTTDEICAAVSAPAGFTSCGRAQIPWN